MAVPYFRNFILKNESTSFTVFPMVWDQSGTTVLWDGSGNDGNEVTQQNEQKFDLNIIGKVPNNTVVVLGCKIKGGKDVMDTINTRTYINTSPSAAIGRFHQDQTILIDPAQAAGLDPAAFQAAYLKLNNPAVAKLLHTIANLISPDSPEISAIA